jgi:hypothetical protein
MPDLVSQKELAIERLNRKKAETAQSASTAAHIANKINPHEVTKAQVGLGNVTDDAQVKKIASSTAHSLMAFADDNGDTPEDVGYGAATLSRAVTKQINGANSAVTNQEEIHGFGWVQGDGTRDITVTVYFQDSHADFFADDFVFVHAWANGARLITGGAPTDPLDMIASSGYTVTNAELPSRAGFTLRLQKFSNDGGAPTTFLNTYYYGFEWLVKGTKAR